MELHRSKYEEYIIMNESKHLTFCSSELSLIDYILWELFPSVTF